jgi:DNA-binding transcriptional regulator YdaS (Cro superfamily)
MRTEEAISWAGGTQQKLADKLGCSQSSVSEWGDFPPDGRQLQIELLSRGRLRAEPNVFKRRKKAA